MLVHRGGLVKLRHSVEQILIGTQRDCVCCGADFDVECKAQPCLLLLVDCVHVDQMSLMLRETSLLAELPSPPSLPLRLQRKLTTGERPCS